LEKVHGAKKINLTGKLKKIDPKDFTPKHTIASSLSMKTNTDGSKNQESDRGCLGMKKYIEIKDNVMNTLDEINFLRLQSEVYHKNVMAKLRSVHFMFEEIQLSNDDYKTSLKSLLDEVSVQVDEVQKINGKVKVSVGKLSSKFQQTSNAETFTSDL
jgi:hypothetical protein